MKTTSFVLLDPREIPPEVATSVPLMLVSRFLAKQESIDTRLLKLQSSRHKCKCCFGDFCFYRASFILFP